MIADRILFAVGACLLALAALGSASAQERAVTNVAAARWSAGGQDFTVESNRVSFQVDSPAQMTTYVAMPGGSENVSLRASYCGTSGSELTTQAAPTLAAVSLQPSSQMRVGQRLVIRLDAPGANANSGQVEHLNIRLTTPEGDEEEISAMESGPATGIFYGAIATTLLPPPLHVGDCQLSLKEGDTVSIAGQGAGAASTLLGEMQVLADPFGLVFSSRDGAPVNGARVTIVDDATGNPAKVFAFDGVTPYPSTVVTGQPVTDSSGTVYPAVTGEYRFPLLAFGRYRLVVEPPAPFAAPSIATPAALSLLMRPDGHPFEISDGSYGRVFEVKSLDPIRVDIPLDSAGGSVSLEKRVSRDEAQPGDALFYRLTVRNVSDGLRTDPITITDSSSPSLRLNVRSVRLDGEAAVVAPAGDGHGFRLSLPALAPGESHELTYAMTVAADAQPGQAINRASAQSGDDAPVQASAGVKIDRDGIADRMTLVGRILAGSCATTDGQIGIPGVRVMLEDGSFAVTDSEGRYHFDGLVPGTHVVRAIGASLPQGGRFLDCARSARSAGSAESRFVTGQGGSLVRADFTAALPENALTAAAGEAAEDKTDAEAAGAGFDWLTLGDGPDEILFPATEHNPRSPAIRVVVRHRPGQTPTLAVNGRATDPLAYEGVTVSPDKQFAISVWRGVRLPGDTTQLTVSLTGGDGTAPTVLEREVHYADTPMTAELLRDRSHLIADGVTPPVLAVRLLDRRGRPVHAGISGSFNLQSPYEAVSAQLARQGRELTGFGASGATWIVEGDDGVAMIELAPTMVSGALRATFSFSDGDTQRESELEAWIEPGDQPWTLIGLAEGSLGARTVADNMERDGSFDSDLGEEARVAFYAKGRVLGSYLLTMAYDSAKQKADQRLLGAIDPSTYYTVYGDSTERLYDAASREKLYVRIEGRAFYAMFGDFETGFDQTDLARYQRIATGVKAEAKVGGVQAQAFAAKVGTRHRREEFQGGGVSGPYPLASRAIIANSEQVAIEVRDRLRSELVIERRELVRFVDYDIDPLSGTIQFSQPILSRDPALNPQFIVIDYETDELGDSQWNAGARAAWTSEDGKVRIGATAITDKGDEARTNLAAADLRLRIGSGTEVRAEAAVSRSEGENATAFSAEVEHREGDLDLLAYARQIDDDFGVGQQNLSERGRRKIGADARVSLTEQLSVIGSAWHDESLTDASRRNAVELRTAWRGRTTDAYLGVAHLSDHLADGTDATSTVLEGGATQRLFDQRLELSAAGSIALADTNSIDLPARYRFGARYAITPQIRAIGTYEIAKGDAIDARTLQGGFELSPWTGSKVTTTLGSQTLGADANRTFASFALGQSLPITPSLTLDATLDANRTLGGGISVSDTINPAHPVSSGGHLGQDGSLGEDFTAATLGIAWQKERWSARARGEVRDGETTDRKGFNAAAIRQLGEGSVIGAGFNWTRADEIGGASSEVQDASLALALRPDGREFALLSKLEYRSDEIQGGTAGALGPVGATRLTVDGDARSRRLMASASGNWTPRDGAGRERGELGLFVALRHNLDRYDGFDLADTTFLAGADVRVPIGDRIEIGARANVRASVDGGATSFSAGPEIGFVPADNMLVSVGYNVVGFRDPDFAEARHTERGVFAAVKIKFDEGSFGFLGLGGR